MKIRWTQISETAWYGRRSGDRFVTEITRDGAYYFVDGCKYAYLSLRAPRRSPRGRYFARRQGNPAR
jgi:hypothetical protein